MLELPNHEYTHHLGDLYGLAAIGVFIHTHNLVLLSANRACSW